MNQSSMAKYRTQLEVVNTLLKVSESPTRNISHLTEDRQHEIKTDDGVTAHDSFTAKVNELFEKNKKNKEMAEYLDFLGYLSYPRKTPSYFSADLKISWGRATKIMAIEKVRYVLQMNKEYLSVILEI